VKHSFVGGLAGRDHDGAKMNVNPVFLTNKIVSMRSDARAKISNHPAQKVVHPTASLFSYELSDCRNYAGTLNSARLQTP
jgi:hypothetical protein